MPIHAKDWEYLTQHLDDLNSATLFGNSPSQAANLDIDRLRGLVDDMINLWLSLEGEESLEESFTDKLVAHGMQQGVAEKAGAWLRGKLLPHAEAIAIGRVPVTSVEDICKSVYDHWILIADDEESLAALKALGCQSTTHATDVRSLVERVWRWHIWLRQRTKSVDYVLGVPWNEIARHIEVIEAFGQQNRQELLMYFLARTLEEVHDLASGGTQ